MNLQLNRWQLWSNLKSPCAPPHVSGSVDLCNLPLQDLYLCHKYWWDREHKVTSESSTAAIFGSRARSVGPGGAKSSSWLDTPHSLLAISHFTQTVRPYISQILKLTLKSHQRIIFEPLLTGKHQMQQSKAIYIFVSLWQPMIANQSRCKPITAYDILWHPKTAYDNLWQSTKPYYSLWKPMPAYDILCKPKTA